MTGFVGRTAQLAALHDAHAAAVTGDPITVLLGGEAGVGKSRLINEFAIAAADSGTRVVFGQCVDLGGLSYAPIAGILREFVQLFGAERLLEIAGPGRDALTGLLPELGAGSAAFEDGRSRLFEVVAVLLERLSADQPLLLIIEDIHWADRSTTDVLRFVVRAVNAAPVMIVATYRNDEVGRAHPLRPVLAELERIRNVHRVDVPRMTRDEVSDLLTDITGSAPAPQIVASIYERSEGNPFFVEELLAADPDCGSAGLPDALRDVLLVRVDQLSDRAQALLRILATGGNRVGHRLLAEVSGLDETEFDETLREAIAANAIVVDGDTYAFRHALLREALYRDILPGSRARSHSRYAAAIEGDPSLVTARAAPSALAHHWYRAHDQERAFRASLRAADEATRAYAHAEAQHCLESALELWGQVADPEGVSGGDNIDLLLRVAEAAYNAGELDRSIALAEAALAEPGVDKASSRFAQLLMRRITAIGNLDRADAVASAADALDQLPDDSPMRPQFLAVLAGRRMTAGQTDEAAHVAREAITAANAIGDAEAAFRAYHVLGPSVLPTGDEEAVLDAFRNAEALIGGDTRRQVSYHINYSDSLALLGRYRDAVEVARTGLAVARDIGLERSSGAMLSGNLAEPLIEIGQWGEASQIINRTLELDPPGRHYWHLLNLRSYLELWRGELDAATATLGELRARMARYRPGPQYVVPMTRTLTYLALARSDPDAAWGHVAPWMDKLDDIRPIVDLPVITAAAATLAALRRAGADVSEDVVPRLLNITDRLDRATMHPGPALVRAELSDGTGADPAAWKTVLDTVSDADGPALLRSYAAYRLADSHVQMGDRSAAIAAVQAAEGSARELGAHLIARWSIDLMRRANLSPASRAAGMPDGFRGLTDRELEVLRLVAAGRSNREIGEELFISAKTASVHVSNILTKLGVSGRGEAAAIAHQNALA